MPTTSMLPAPVPRAIPIPGLTTPPTMPHCTPQHTPPLRHASPLSHSTPTWTSILPSHLVWHSVHYAQHPQLAPPPIPLPYLLQTFCLPFTLPAHTAGCTLPRQVLHCLHLPTFPPTGATPSHTHTPHPTCLPTWSHWRPYAVLPVCEDAYPGLTGRSLWRQLCPTPTLPCHLPHCVLLPGCLRHCKLCGTLVRTTCAKDARCTAPRPAPLCHLATFPTHNTRSW